jgi:hypothetical protein
MTKMEKLKEVTELQTIGGLLLDIELRNGMDDISDMIAEIRIEMEEGVDEESLRLEPPDSSGTSSPIKLSSFLSPTSSLKSSALIGEKLSSLNEILLGMPGCEVVEAKDDSTDAKNQNTGPVLPILVQNIFFIS